MNLNRYNKFIDAILPDIGINKPYDFTDKSRSIAQSNAYFLARTQRMFKWNGLPESIPQRNLELLIQTCGIICVTSVDGTLYAFNGGLSNEPNAYYEPTHFIVANPYLNFNKNLKIDEECIIIRNDSLAVGLLPIIQKHSTLLAENEISLNIASINSRIQSLISAGDDATRLGAEKYLADVLEGKLGIIAESQFLDGVRAQPYGTANNGNTIGKLIEYHQYIKASLYNELGIQSQFNLKREAINSAESSLNDDILIPLIDDMLIQRQEAAEKINKLYGTDISVTLDSVWLENEEERELELEVLEDEAEGGEEDGDEDSKPDDTQLDE